MDRYGRAAAVLSLALACLLLVAANTSGVSAIRAARWMPKDADAVRVLGTVEAECLGPVSDETAYLVEVGRAAFRTPLLLGGQAARAGITCESCHQGGRRNADFQFPGLSGAAGTADVTTALFSSHRDDGIDNPKSIPDLGGPKSRLRVSQDPTTPQLEAFIHGQITEEFNGAEPPPAVLKGLATYVRTLRPEACPSPERRPLHVTDYAQDAERAVKAAIAALDHRDLDTAVLMLEAARSRLGLIDERYDQPDAADSRAYLATADADLAAALQRVRAADPGVRGRLAVWLVRARSGRAVLQAEEPGSLFSPNRLR